MPKTLTQQQIQSIVLDAAILYINEGETDQRIIGITKGGVEFNVTENVRDIEYDGRRGYTKGMRVVDEINSYLKCTTLEATQDNLFLALGAATKATSGKISGNAGGVVSNFVKNVTAYGICNATGSYKKIKIYNASAAGGLTFGTTDKGEGTFDLQLNAHWDPTSMSDIYEIEDVSTMPA